MRTTLTIDDDVARLIEEAVRETRQSYKRVVNAALRRALGPSRAGVPYEPREFPGGPAPGVDPRRLNQLADQIEAEELSG